LEDEVMELLLRPALWCPFEAVVSIFNFPRDLIIEEVLLPVGEGWGIEVVEAARPPLLRPFFTLGKSGCEPRPATDLAGLLCLDWKNNWINIHILWLYR
jgi:hypothetical protein